MDGVFCMIELDYVLDAIHDVSKDKEKYGQCKIFCGIIHFNHTIILLFFPLFSVPDNIKLN